MLWVCRAYVWKGFKLVAAYFWQASQHVYMRCWCRSCHLRKSQHTDMQNISTFTTPVANTSKELLCLFIFQVISSLFGTVGFFLVEWKARRNAQQGYAPISWDFVGLSPSLAITIVLSAIQHRLFLGLLRSARALSNNNSIFPPGLEDEGDSLPLKILGGAHDASKVSIQWP